MWRPPAASPGGFLPSGRRHSSIAWKRCGMVFQRVTDSASTSKLAKDVTDAADDAVPVARRGLTEQPDVRIPGARLTIEHPAPIRLERHQQRDRPPERPRHMRDRC